MFVALRDLRFAKGRFALMGTVVVLITVLVGLLSGLTSGLANKSTSAITGLPADHLVFAGAGDSVSFADSSLPEQVWQQWADVEGVRAAEPLAIQRTSAATVGQTGGKGARAGVALFGVRPDSSLVPAPEALSSGHVVLSEGAAQALSVSAGDTILIGGQKLTVAAVAGTASYSHSSVVWITLADYRDVTEGAGGSGPSASVLALRTTETADLAAADERIGTTTMPVEASLGAIGSFSAENTSLRLMRAFLFAISALVIGAFFTVWTIQRSSDVAVLKALGASTWYLLRDALGQAIVVLTVGTALGAAVAAGIGALVAGTVPFVVSFGTTVLPMLVMIALGAVGAGLSIRRITAVDPLTALGSAR